MIQNLHSILEIFLLYQLVILKCLFNFYPDIRTNYSVYQPEV